MKLYTHIPSGKTIIKLNNNFYITSHDSLSYPEFHSLEIFSGNTIKHPKFNLPFNLIQNPTQEFISNLK